MSDYLSHIVVSHFFPCLHVAGTVLFFFSCLSLCPYLSVSPSLSARVCVKRVNRRQQGWCRTASILCTRVSLAPQLAEWQSVPAHAVPSFIPSFSQLVSQPVILTHALTHVPLLSQECVSKQNEPDFLPSWSLYSTRKRQARHIINK